MVFKKKNTQKKVVKEEKKYQEKKKLMKGKNEREMRGYFEEVNKRRHKGSSPVVIRIF